MTFRGKRDSRFKTVDNLISYVKSHLEEVSVGIGALSLLIT